MSTANRSNYTDGLDHPTRSWLQKVVRSKTQTQWGTGRVLRWYPAAAGLPARLRVRFENISAPQVVSVADVEIVDS